MRKRACSHSLFFLFSLCSSLPVSLCYSLELTLSFFCSSFSLARALFSLSSLLSSIALSHTHSLSLLPCLPCRLQGHPHVEMDTSDCKLGVPLTDNKHGTAFSAENICDTCDVLLSTSRTRSDILCARNTVKNANAAQTSLLSKTPQSVGGGGEEVTGTRDFTPKQAQEWQTSSSNDFQNSRTHEHARTREHGTHARDQGSSRSLSLSSIAGEMHVLEYTVSDLNSTVNNLLKKVSSLELQHDWSQVATTYVTCSLGMTWRCFHRCRCCYHCRCLCLFLCLCLCLCTCLCLCLCLCLLCCVCVHVSVHACICVCTSDDIKNTPCVHKTLLQSDLLMLGGFRKYCNTHTRAHTFKQQ